jgi:Uncharacterised nucleotidyltransferase
VRAEPDLGKRADTVAGTLAVDAETVRVVMALQASGVRVLLLRGAAYIEFLRYPPGERMYVDSDLLISRSDFGDAEQVLIGLGYHESELEAAFAQGRPRHAHTWMGPRGTVDLHRTIIGVEAEPERVWELLSSRTNTITLLERNVEVLDETANLFVLSLHAAQHPGDTQISLDLTRAAIQFDLASWNEAAGLSRRLGAEATFGVGLRTTPHGADLARRLKLREQTLPHHQNRGSAAFHLAQGAIWMANQRGWAARLRFLRRKVVPSAVRMRNESRLARQGGVGLALAHARRWIALSQHAPQALRALVRLRREQGRRS